MNKALLMLASLLLSACVEAESTSPDGIGEVDAMTGNTYAAETVFMKDVDPDYPRAGVTYASDGYNELHLEYFAPDGTVHLWYAGQSKTLTGEWMKEGETVCLRPAATGQTAGRWDCGSPAAIADDVVAMVEGDPYGLQDGTPPAHDLRNCRLPPGMLLKKKMGCVPGLSGLFSDMQRHW